MVKVLFKSGIYTIDHPVYQAITRNLPDGWSLVGQEPADLVMIPTVPDFDSHRPWIVFIEDWVTLYRGVLMNGSTVGFNPDTHPFTNELRARFSNPNFKGIFCHHRGTFDDLVRLNLTDKLYYIPIGYHRKDMNVIGDKPELTFTFINSWRAANYNFKNRGGELVMAAFRKLVESGENIRLNLLLPFANHSKSNALNASGRHCCCCFAKHQIR